MEDTEIIAKMIESFKSDMQQDTIGMRATDGSTIQWCGSNGTVQWCSYAQQNSFSPINISPYPQQAVVNNKPCPNEPPPTNTFATCSRFLYVLDAPTSPATKLNEEPMTFLNQGQSYEIEMACLDSLPEYPSLKSVVRVTFSDRRLQFTEKEQLQVWKQERHPTEKLIEIDFPLCYGISCGTDDANDLNTVEFFWNCHQRAAVGIKLNCVSTEFTAKKCGGERGVALRVQVDTYGLMHPHEQTVKLLHSAYCLVKVFKPKGAERKLKIDKEWFNRLPAENQKSYRPSLEKTILIEVSEEEISKYQSHVSSTSSTSTTSCHSSQNYVQSSLISTTKLHASTLHQESSELQHQSKSSCPFVPHGLQDSNNNNKILFSKNFELSEDTTQQEVVQWMKLNQFDSFIETLNKFSGADLLRLSRQDFIDICGVAEGIRFCNAVHGRPVRPKLALYICSQGIDCESDLCHPEEGIKRHGSVDSFVLSPASSLSSMSSAGSVLKGTPTYGSLSSSCGPSFGSIHDVEKVSGLNQKQTTRKRRIDSVDDIYDNRCSLKRSCSHRDIITNNVYDLVNLDYLTRKHLVERLAALCGLQLSRISEIYLQNAKGLTIDVTDLVVEHFEDESHFKLEIAHAIVDLCPVTVLLLRAVAKPQNMTEVQL